MTGSTIPLLTIEAQIKRRLRRHLREIGFSKDRDGLLVAPTTSKEAIRRLHRRQRAERLKAAEGLVESGWQKFSTYYADGYQVHPPKIDPRLEPISSHSWQAELFRLTALSWSIPVSQGFGRRIRYLVWDKHNDCLIGLLALGDPVFNLRVRDEHIGWTVQQRKKKLVNVLDAYVLGAIPPYSMLLGGKLIACLIRTREVKELFESRYGNKVGLISGQNKSASLLSVTTTSALGRSSVYNRLNLNGIHYMKGLGFTDGWGHFHVPEDLFQLMRLYLKECDDDYATNYKYGDGPNWKFRAIRKCLARLDLNRDLLRHSIKREVFISHLAGNSIELLSEVDDGAPDFSTLKDIETVTDEVKKRWIVPRSRRKPSYKEWDKAEFQKKISYPQSCHDSLEAEI